MRIPLIVRIGALVLATTGFYTYVGQMVPQKEVQPPQEAAMRSDLTTADMVKVGREIMEGKGLCLTCHTIGKTGALRFPDLAGVDVRAKSRVPGLSDVEYFAQSMYEPNAYVVPGFPPAMPAHQQASDRPHRSGDSLRDRGTSRRLAARRRSRSRRSTTTTAVRPHRRGAGSRGGSGAGRRAGGAPEAAPPTGRAAETCAILQPVAAHQPARHEGAVTR